MLTSQTLGQTVEDFIQEFRDRIGDTSKSVMPSTIISCLTTALRRLARTDGMDKLFEYRDVYELSAINRDGTPSAAWNLGNIGSIIDIQQFKALKADSGGICKIFPRYKEYNDFFDEHPLPETNTPGNPDYYTFEQIGTITRLLFNRPPDKLLAIDMKYSAFHPRITSIEDNILMAYDYCDLLIEYCIILHKIETTDQSTARALYEDLDLLVTEAKELLAKRKGTLNYRVVPRSF